MRLEIVYTDPSLLGPSAVEEHDHFGSSIRITTAARTVADMFRFRNRVGLELALETLRTYASRTQNFSDLLEQAERLRVDSILTPTSRRSDMSSAQSIRDRLTRLARERNLDVQLTLTTFAIERTLYRLSLTSKAESYILKGAKLPPPVPARKTITAPHRTGTSWREANSANIWKTPSLKPSHSIYRTASTTTSTACIVDIREGNAYSGLRVHIPANLAGARLRVQLDIAFGDAVVPANRDPLPHAAKQTVPNLEGYAVETVVTEKLRPVTSLGLINSR